MRHCVKPWLMKKHEPTVIFIAKTIQIRANQPTFLMLSTKLIIKCLVSNLTANVEFRHSCDT